jgi:hypothetical protein
MGQGLDNGLDARETAAEGRGKERQVDNREITSVPAT